MPITSDFRTFAKRCNEKNNELYEVAMCWCAGCNHVGYADILKTCIHPTEEEWFYESWIRAPTKVMATPGYCDVCNVGGDTTLPIFNYDENSHYSRRLR